MGYRVMMSIDGREVPSSCIKSGPLAACNETAARLNRRAHERVKWVVLPCIDAPAPPVVSGNYVAALSVRIKGRPAYRASVAILHHENHFHVKRMAEKVEFTKGGAQ